MPLLHLEALPPRTTKGEILHLLIGKNDLFNLSLRMCADQDVGVVQRGVAQLRLSWIELPVVIPKANLALKSVRAELDCQGGWHATP